MIAIGRVSLVSNSVRQQLELFETGRVEGNLRSLAIAEGLSRGR